MEVLMEAVQLHDLENKLSREQLVRFLMRFAFNLTVVARNCYQVGGDDVEKPKALRGINEMEHRVLSYARHMLNGTQGCPYSSLASQVVELAKLYGCTFELENALSFSLENLEIY